MMLSTVHDIFFFCHFISYVVTWFCKNKKKKNTSMWKIIFMIDDSLVTAPQSDTVINPLRIYVWCKNSARYPSSLHIFAFFENKCKFRRKLVNKCIDVTKKIRDKYLHILFYGHETPHGLLVVTTLVYFTLNSVA